MSVSSLREEIYSCVQSKYGSDIEYLWRMRRLIEQAGTDETDNL